MKWLVYTDARPEPFPVVEGEPLTVPVACRVLKVEEEPIRLPTAVLRFREENGVFSLVSRELRQ